MRIEERVEYILESVLEEAEEETHIMKTEYQLRYYERLLKTVSAETGRYIDKIEDKVLALRQQLTEEELAL